MLIDFYTHRGQLHDAMLAAAATYEGNIVMSPSVNKHNSKSTINGVQNGQGEGELR